MNGGTARVKVGDPRLALPLSEVWWVVLTGRNSMHLKVFLIRHMLPLGLISSHFILHALSRMSRSIVRVRGVTVVACCWD